jgi:hypothetical protein
MIGSFSFIGTRLQSAKTSFDQGIVKHVAGDESNQSSTASRNDFIARCSLSAWVMTSIGGAPS